MGNKRLVTLFLQSNEINVRNATTNCSLQVGILSYLVKEIDHLVRGSAWWLVDVDMTQCQQCGRSPGDVLQLESELHLTQEAADRLQRNLAEKTEESKRHTEEATSFKNQVRAYSIHCHRA